MNLPADVPAVLRHHHDRAPDLAVPRAPPHRRAQRVPRRWGLLPRDAALIVLGNALLIVAMWVRHGQFPNLTHPAAVLTGAGQIAALLGTYSALVQVVLMSRSPWLDDLFGIDRLAGWHRWLGFATLYLLSAHVVLTTAGYAMTDGRSFLAQTWVFLTTYPYMLMTYVGFGLFILVAVTSVRAARRHVSHQAWHFIHLYVYLAIALTFAHQLAVGTDFVNDPVAVGYWVALYAVAAALVVTFRLVIPARMALRHRLRVQRLVAESPGRALHLHHRTRPRRAADARRPVLQVPLPDPRAVVAGPPLLALGGAQRPSTCASPSSRWGTTRGR